MYYVYDYNPYAKEYIMNLPSGSNLDTVHPQMEVIHPMNHPDLRGVDKVGSMLCFKNNRYYHYSIYTIEDGGQVVLWMMLMLGKY